MKKILRFPLSAGWIAAGAILSLVPAAQGQWSAPDGSVRFLAVGDWGRDGKAAQLPVAEQMGRAAAKDRSQFVVSLGDNFYNDGVASVESRQWTTSFEDIYSAPSLQVPWYVVLGNHDYHINPEAEVEYTLYSPRWKLPTRYYTFIRRIDLQTTVQFFMLDSTPYAEPHMKRNAAAGQLPMPDTRRQTAWLEAELKLSTAQWKIVCAHHPVYSSGGHHGDTPAMIAAIEPLLEKYGVQVFLNGHEHNLQHLRIGQINYFCSGAGSLATQVGTDRPALFTRGQTGGFLEVELTANEFHGRFIDAAGKSLYETKFERDPQAAR